MEADIMVWDPDAEFVVDPSRLRQRHKQTPYAGRRLRGRVRETYLRGELVYRDVGTTDSHRMAGVLIRRV
jgi:allantoinase